jgi:hypothetical protein
MASDNEGERWTVDRKIPIVWLLGVAGLVAVQTWFFATWKQEATSDIAAFKDFMRSAAPQSAQIAVIQEKVTNLSEEVRRLDDHIRSSIAPK